MLCNVGVGRSSVNTARPNQLSKTSRNGSCQQVWYTKHSTADAAVSRHLWCCGRRYRIGPRQRVSGHPLSAVEASNFHSSPPYAPAHGSMHVEHSFYAAKRTYCSDVNSVNAHSLLRKSNLLACSCKVQVRRAQERNWVRCQPSVGAQASLHLLCQMDIKRTQGS